MRYGLFIRVLLCVVLAGSAAAAQECEPLRVVARSGAVHDFQVEVADTAQERQIGLMFRRILPPDHGMLFDYRHSRRVSMWMKNTLIPLDMLFIEADGTIESIRERAVPHSLESIPSEGRVQGVLELPGGTVERLGITPGDRVVHHIFE